MKRLSVFDVVNICMAVMIAEGAIKFSAPWVRPAVCALLILWVVADYINNK